jgi:hypothetical protein
MATPEQLSTWFDKGYDDGYTHMIVCCDEFDQDDDDHGSYPFYVNDHFANLSDMLATAQLKPMQHVHEVYALWLNRDRQLRSARAWNTSPSPRPKSITLLSCGCRIPWKAEHRKTVTVTTCNKHGIVAIAEIH